MNSPDLLGKFLAHFDPVSMGWSPFGIAYGAPVWSGLVTCCCPKGGYVVYRRVQGGAFDWSDPVGRLTHDATVMRNYAWRSHVADTVYEFTIVPIGPGGVPGNPTAPIQAPINAGKTGYGPRRPNPVSALSVEPLDGGRFRLSWNYQNYNQGAPPRLFSVRDGSGQIGTVVAVLNQRRYSFVTDAYTDDTLQAFSVRPVAASGGEQTLGPVVSLRAKSATPAGSDGTPGTTPGGGGTIGTPTYPEA